MQYSAEWERINDNTWRMELPGGWLVKTVELSGTWDVSGPIPVTIGCALCYVPDPDMAWMVKKG